MTRTEIIKGRTPEGIRLAIEAMMKDNPRKQVFHACALSLGAELRSAPETDDLEAYPIGMYEGVRGIRRQAWRDVPGYAERVCNYLAGIMTGKRARLN